MLKLNKNAKAFLQLQGSLSIFVLRNIKLKDNRLHFFLFFPRARLFQPRRGDFKKLFEVFSFFVPRGTDDEGLAYHFYKQLKTFQLWVHLEQHWN